MGIILVNRSKISNIEIVLLSAVANDNNLVLNVEEFVSTYK